MQIVINDANILIDLFELDLLNAFFALSFDFLVTDLVLAELHLAQAQALKPFIDAGKLAVKIFTAEELLNIAAMQTSNLSIPDCSAFYVAKMTVVGWLFTGDANLRKTAERQGCVVKGILFIFRELVAQGHLSTQDGTDKLRLLMQRNSRLPSKDCNDLLDDWARSISPAP